MINLLNILIITSISFTGNDFLLYFCALALTTFILILNLKILFLNSWKIDEKYYKLDKQKLKTLLIFTFIFLLNQGFLVLLTTNINSNVLLIPNSLAFSFIIICLIIIAIFYLTINSILSSIKTFKDIYLSNKFRNNRVNIYLIFLIIELTLKNLFLANHKNHNLSFKLNILKFNKFCIEKNMELNKLNFFL
ncbi:hypothetical protein SCHIN_v1c06900 [Spiroplasma chinense]|uniref:Uncharacterized protein n=1 Tax=Spiroplasma chinense TaxID=216932 RepID=A0A5B9Y6J7_9MOLU|nr:hypothetical protein SCHIN_v1c06900 [Spiroplasma chinense]